MVKPDYRGGGIVNLMSSLRAGLGDPSCCYPTTPALPVDEIARTRRVFFLVVDGLGDNLLRRRCSGGALSRHRRSRLSSVFPSTTATAVTTFLTGEAPQQHALTGWFTYFRELDEVLAVLPFVPRRRDASQSDVHMSPAELLEHVPIFDRLAVSSHQVMPDSIAYSPFNLAHAGSARIHAYGDLEQLFATAADILLGHPGPVYIHAYWPEIDALSHGYGPSSDKVAEQLQRLDKELGLFLERVADSNTVIVVCADHGLIDTDEDHSVRLEDHPSLAATLALPLCGEPRVAFCYVREGREQQFLNYVHEHLDDRLQVFPSERLISEGWYGPGAANPRLKERVGHYTLIMKERYTIKDQLDGEQPVCHRGVHGSTSSDEMYVPLIVAHTEQ